MCSPWKFRRHCRKKTDADYNKHEQFTVFVYYRAWDDLINHFKASDKLLEKNTSTDNFVRRVKA